MFLFTYFSCTFSTKCRLLEVRENITYSKAPRCPKCYTYFSNNVKTCKIQSERKTCRFARRLLLKCARNEPLTQYQNKYKKRMKQTSGNKLVIHLVSFNKHFVIFLCIFQMSTCSTCRTQAEQHLTKPKKESTLKSEPLNTGSKKKKKRKDKFSGLNKQAVLSAFKDKCSEKVSTNLTKNNDSANHNAVSTSLKKNNKVTLKVNIKNKHVEKIKVQKQTRKINNNLLKINSMLHRSETESNANSLKNFLKNL